MAEPAKVEPHVPGVLRGTALYRCETYRHERQEPPTKKVDFVAQKFDADLWSDFKGQVDAYMNILSGNCKLDDISMEDQRDPGKYPSGTSAQSNVKASQECKSAFDPKPDPNEGWFSAILSACGRAFTRVSCAMQYSENQTVAHSGDNKNVGDHDSKCHGYSCYR